MAFANRIKVTTATTGTGALTLSGTGVRDATSGDCLAPAEVSEDLASRIIPYFIVSGSNFAYGNGKLSANCLTLTRDSKEVSWNGTTRAVALLSLTGTSTVMLTPRAKDLQAGSMGVSIMIAAGMFAN